MAVDQDSILAPHPSHRFIQSSPTGFRDATGRNVVLDLDGFGTADLRAGVTWEGVDDSGRFQNFATASSSDPLAQASVLLGQPLPLLPLSTKLQGSFTGSGWLVGGNAELDGMHEFTVPSGRFPAPFFQSAIGHGQIVEANDVRWQLLSEIVISEADQLSAVGWRVQNMSEVTELRSTFPDGFSHSGLVASHLNEGSFEIELPLHHQGILIEKLGDVFHGRQRARVLINDAPVGWWSEPTQDRTSRWR